MFALKAMEYIQPDVSTVDATTSEVTIVEQVKVPYSGSKAEPKEVEEIEMEMYPQFEYDKDWNEKEEYLLAKIAMAEAEGENLYTKTFVILTVLNRVHSNQFGNTIKEVIFEKIGNTYQFSPVMPNGRWWNIEPNEECYEAVQVVKEAMYDYSGGALYFESCSNEDNWHSRNLEYLYQNGNMRFYK